MGHGSLNNYHLHGDVFVFLCTHKNGDWMEMVFRMGFPNYFTRNSMVFFNCYQTSKKAGWVEWPAVSCCHWNRVSYQWVYPCFFFEGTPWQDFFSIPQVANPWSPDIWRSQTLRRWSQDMTMNFHICPDDCGHSICQKHIFIPIHTFSYIFRYGSLNWNTSHQNNICYLLFGFRRAQRPSAGSRPLKTSKCTWWPLISIVHAPSSSSGRRSWVDRLIQLIRSKFV